MTDHDDELLELLAAADPIDPEALPSADEPAARALMETIMHDHPTDGTAADGPATGVTNPESGLARALDLPAVPGVERYSRRHRRSRALLAGAAAAVLLLVAGVFVFSPDNTAPALAEVQGAAEATAGAESGRVSTTFSLSGTDGTESEQLAGILDASFSGTDIALEVEIDEASGASRLGELPASEARLVDGVLYVNDGAQWFAIESANFLGQSLVDFVDPRSVLSTVQQLLDTEEIGRVDVDGVETTHFRSVVDLGDESLGQSGWLALEGIEVDAEGEITIDLFVGDDGLLQQLDVSGDVQESDGGSGSATFTVSSSFFDLGSDVVVEAPADSVSIDPLQGFGQDD